ncbi:MAG: sugar phosphate isomerase [Chloroflexi bacterium RBG_16_48_8]|nr:MAG: sugar phosphate isomerase [Chloroflexi bacterium RBG_16_48_8]
MSKVAIGCDPNANELKEVLKDHLSKMGVDFDDYGSDDPIYANVAFEVVEAVAGREHERGILLCSTGIGMCIAANKVSGVYAALCSDTYSAIRARKSNNANILTFRAWLLGPELAKEIVTKWLESEYIPGGCSEPKIQRIYEYEREHQNRNYGESYVRTIDG